MFDTVSRNVFCSTSEKYKSEKELIETAAYIQAQEDAYFDNFCQANGIGSDYERSY